MPRHIPISKVLDLKLKNFYKNTGVRPNLIIIGEEAFYDLKNELDVLMKLNYGMGGFTYKGVKLLSTAYEEDLHQFQVGNFKVEGDY